MALLYHSTELLSSVLLNGAPKKGNPYFLPLLYHYIDFEHAEVLACFPKKKAPPISERCAIVLISIFNYAI